MDEIVAAVEESLSPETREEFDARVERQAATVGHDVRSGALDNDDFAVGLELETYATDATGRLVRLPDALFDSGVCGKELGVHNVELNTKPDVFDAPGLERQAASIRTAVREARQAVADLSADTDRPADADADDSIRLPLDAMWTVGPSEGAGAYLDAHTEQDGVVIAENMRRNARYVALDNEILRRAGGSVTLDVPGVERAFPTILVESLATSIQPHLQIPATDDLPTYFDVALRTMAPVLALATNSPFLPAEFYPEVRGEEAHEIVTASHHELRIAVFEQGINAGCEPGREKVRFPRDLTAATDVADRLVADETYAPFLTEPHAEVPDDYTERFPELDHKRGTYWRWLRTVVGGQVPRGTRDRHGDTAGDDNTTASVRLEYRPLPTQPTATDVVGLQCLTVGLIRGLVAADHPVVGLDWADARESFYDVAANGLDADLAWITAEGEETTDSDTVLREVFEYARRGLTEQGLHEAKADAYLAPIDARRRVGTTPSDWKRERVHEVVDDGATLPEAICRMQRDYLERAGRVDSFVDWL
ncbi:hypothetical protein [Salinirubrum litoreum]|uniref:Glutamate--cysteine ligase n=1 Tax=Salinirubrum litoreum TaxID=1126234 RepID=A0ABD5R7Q6_9EURY|nr:hypothetical protein [Salinirubrum litoreum]